MRERGFGSAPRIFMKAGRNKVKPFGLIIFDGKREMNPLIINVEVKK